MRLIVSQRSSFKIILSLLIILLFTFSLDVFSHQRSESYSKWSVEEVENDTLVNVAFTIRLSNLNKLESPLVGEWEDRISAYIISSFTTDSDCLQEGKHRVMTSRADDIFRVSWTLSCNQILGEIKTNVFFDRDPTHSHIARYIYDSNLSTEKLLQDKNIDDTTKQTLMDNHYKEYQYDVNDLSGAEQIDELWHIQATGQSSGKARYSHLVKEQERKDSNVDVKNYITQYLQNTAIQDNDSIFNRQVSNSFFQENNEDMLQAVKQSRELTIKKYVDKALEDKELKDILSNKNLSLDYKFNAIKNLEQKDKTLSYKTKQAFTNLKIVE